MNRNEEYKSLMNELSETPLKLDYTLDRAKARRSALNSRRKTMRSVFIPIGTLTAVFLVFAALVNFSAPFAEACSKVPALSRLAQAVSFNPSLSAAVENDYMQKINLSQTKNGVTAKIEYVIADERQLNFFYSLLSDKHKNMEASAQIKNDDGQYSVSSSYAPNTPDGDLRKIVVNYDSLSTVPDHLALALTVLDASSPDDPESRSEIASFDFALAFDPTRIAECKTIEVNRDFTIDGQSFTLERAEIYPTHMRLNLSENPENTAWLAWLDYYLEDENGDRFESYVGGISATGSESGHSMVTYYADTPYFTGSKHLSLHITGAQWLDKGKENIRVDTKSGTATNLPENVELALVKRTNDGYHLIFNISSPQNDTTVNYLGGVCRDSSGNTLSCTQSVGGVSFTDEDTGKRYESTDAEELFVETPTLSELLLEVRMNRSSELSPPVEIKIR